MLADMPDLILLDEPSNDLDLPALVWLEEWIAARRETVIFISHDETLLENCADSILHLEQVMRKTEPRWTLSRNGYREYVERREDLIGRAAAQAKNDRAAFEKKMERYRHIYERVHHEQNAISRQNPSGGRLLKKKMHTVKAMEKRFERERENLTKKIDAEEAVMIDFPPTSIPAGKTVLDLDLPELRAPDGTLLQTDIRLHVAGGDHLVITGPNGCGKTTLMKKIAEALEGCARGKGVAGAVNHLAAVALQDGDEEVREFPGGLEAEVLLVVPFSLIRIELCAGLLDFIQGKSLNKLVQGEHFAVVAGVPAKHRKKVHEGLGKIAVLAVTVRDLTGLRVLPGQGEHREAQFVTVSL